MVGRVLASARTRSPVVAVALVAGLALSGCYAQTDPPRDVSSTSAQLNAHGRTGSSPAHYYFQYAVSPNALGTGFGRQTPRRGPVPAHVPSDGSNASFSETVTGLDPGTTYYSRVCGGDQQVVPDACANVQSLFTVPSDAQTYVTGSYGFPNTRSTASVQAATGPSGRGPDGYLYYFNTGQAGVGFIFSGHVTCLLVNGNQAAIGAVGQASDYNQPSPFYNQPYTELVTVVRDPTTGTVTIGPEQFQPGSTPPDCTSAPYTGQRTIPNNIVIHPAPAP